MFLLENIRLALSSLKANKMRAALTMLGIIIGICSVVTITSIGNSLQTILNQTFNSLSGRTIECGYDYINETESYRLHPQKTSDYVSMEMLDRFEKNFNGKYLVSRDHSVGSGKIQNPSAKNVNVGVMGASEGSIKENKNLYKLISGRYPSFEDNAGQKHTAVVSDLFLEQYYGKNDKKNALGEDLTINIENIGSTEFTIVGIYKLSEFYIKYGKDATTPLSEFETPVFIPYSTARKLKKPDSSYDEYFTIFVNDNNIPLKKATQEVQEFFDYEYRNAKYWKPEFYDSSVFMNTVDTVMKVLTAVLAVIAAISLIVGGIGVMNIMLVSITERTREIGIRKALGAKNGYIKVQFLIESAILCIVGGIVGILLGAFNGFIFETIGNYILSSNPDFEDLGKLNVSISPSAVIIALIFSTLVGLFFGIYPANKAAKLDPIDALRYE